MKTKDDRKIVWTQEDKDAMRRMCPEMEFLDPQRNPERHDPFAAFGCDLNDIREADFMIADMRQKRGIGIGAELVVAKMLKKPVVSVCPRNSHYRRDALDHHGKMIRNWEHPFMASLSDAVVESPEEAARWVRDFRGESKDGTVVREAIDYFRSKRGSGE
jgi:hypothetical protein